MLTLLCCSAMITMLLQHCSVIIAVANNLLKLSNLITKLKLACQQQWTLLSTNTIFSCYQQPWTISLLHHCSAILLTKCWSFSHMITMLLKHCSGDNLVTTCQIFTLVCDTCTDKSVEDIFQHWAANHVRQNNNRKKKWSYK